VIAPTPPTFVIATGMAIAIPTMMMMPWNVSAHATELIPPQAVIPTKTTVLTQKATSRGISVTVAITVAIPIVWPAVSAIWPITVATAAKYLVFAPKTRPSNSGTLTTSNA
jgi:hypothetical protein